MRLDNNNNTSMHACEFVVHAESVQRLKFLYILLISVIINSIPGDAIKRWRKNLDNQAECDEADVGRNTQISTIYTQFLCQHLLAKVGHLIISYLQIFFFFFWFMNLYIFRDFSSFLTYDRHSEVMQERPSNFHYYQYYFF